MRQHRPEVLNLSRPLLSLLLGLPESSPLTATPQPLNGDAAGLEQDAWLACVLLPASGQGSAER